MASIYNKSDYTVNVTGSFTIDPILDGLNFWFNKIGIHPSVRIAGFNQIFRQLLDPTADFNSEDNQINIIIVRLEDLDTESGTGQNRFSEFRECVIQNLSEFRSNKLIIVFALTSDVISGREELLTKYRTFEQEINLLSDLYANLSVIKSENFYSRYNISDYYEPLGEKIGNIPFKDNFFAAASSLIARKLNPFKKSPIKAIAVDCDNTLWQGVVGELGPEHIQIGSQERELQEYLISLNKSGLLICLCSRNNERDVWEVFEKNPHMLLKREHISFAQINWEHKSENLRKLSEEINIGLDSFLFLDDNPLECSEMKANAPSVLTLRKNNHLNSIGYLQNCWALDRDKITEEDTKRSGLYKLEAERLQIKNKMKSFAEYIKELDIRIEILPATEAEVSRISQLTFRTNQFNFSSIRRDEDEIISLLDDSSYSLYSVRLIDKIGDYGIVGCLIIRRIPDRICIDTFLLSCRALGKGVEYKMISFLGKYAADEHLEDLEICFTETEKNAVAMKFLQEITTEQNDSFYYMKADAASALTFNPYSVNRKENIRTGKDIRGIVNNNIFQRNSFYEEVSESLFELESITRAIYSSDFSENFPVHQITGSDLEISVARIWRDVLKVPRIEIDDNFFDIGGKSILIPKILIRLENELSVKTDIVDIFQNPTIRTLSRFIENGKHSEVKSIRHFQESEKTDLEDLNSGIAVVGMAGRFPGASDIYEYWEIIREGKETVSRYTREDLEQKGVPPELLDNPDYVYADAILDGAENFDSAFFGFSPLEADFMDPQHRLFLEICYQALEHAGYKTINTDNNTGVFAGSGPENYLLKNLSKRPEILRSMGELQVVTGNGKDYLTTNVSYKLNLKGPSMDIQTACSTSLVSIHTACLNLLAGQCDMALAGGSFVQIPRGKGYLYRKGEIFSRKGQCRPFDQDSDGMLFGEGSAAVVLKKYSDAVRDNDTIWAVIKGSAINNDGAVKAGYMAPGVSGQSEVISRAQKMAGVHPEDITYIETHGTGTRIGDPIEIKALTDVFSAATDQKNFCTLGSVKANIGHLDAGAGVAGLIKTVLCLKNKQIPPSINFSNPNPALKLENSPFLIDTDLRDWETGGKPRIAAVSSFGVGGTNAHCILQETPEQMPEESVRDYHLIGLSAKTKEAVLRQVDELKAFLNNHKNINIADISYTLHHGRNRMKYRSAVVCRNTIDFLTDKYSIDTGVQEFDQPDLIFMFPGQGSQYCNMGKDLYEEFSTFRKVIDQADNYLKQHSQIRLYDLLYVDNDPEKITQTVNAQLLLFTIHYAVFKLLAENNIKPSVMIGHSIGEISSACISGVFSFENALKLILTRGRLMQDMDPGAMLSIPVSESSLLRILPPDLDLALVNAPSSCVVAGRHQAVCDFQESLKEIYPNSETILLRTSHAFHSAMMEPAARSLKTELADMEFGDITIPFISNTTGHIAGKEQVTSIDYWADHIRSTVRFADSIEKMLAQNNSIFIEVGPGTTLSSLVSQFGSNKRKVKTIPTIRHFSHKVNDAAFFVRVLSRLWIAGADNVYDSYYSEEKRGRIPLPVYPFEKKRHWIEPENSFSYDYLSEKSADTADIESFEAGSSESSEIISADSKRDNPTIKRLSGLWNEMLGIPDIGLDDNFFNLGGHSLLAARIINRINDEYLIDLPHEILFQKPTIRNLAELIESSERKEKNSVDIKEIETTANLPVSVEQQRLWIVSILYSNPAYNIPFTYKISGLLDIQVFHRSLNELFSRHRILRSRIVRKDNTPETYLSEGDEVHLNMVDFSDIAENERHKRLDRFITEDTRTVFNIGDDDLYRLHLIKTSENEYFFHFTVHHLIFDGWSWGVFVKELNSLYKNISSGADVSNSSRVYQYYEYAQWQRDQKECSNREDSVVYWKNSLRGHSGYLNFPYDFKRGDTATGFGGREHFILDKNISDSFRNFCRKQNVTEYISYLSAFTILLHQYSGDTDICIGTPAAGRSHSKFEDIIGFFVNSVVIRTQICPENSFTDFIQDSNKTVIGALEHQDLPFQEIVDSINPKRALNTNPIFQVQFAWQNTPRPPFDFPDIQAERYVLKEGVSPLDITLYMWEEDGRIEGEIEYNTDLLTRNTITDMKDRFINLILNIAENPRRTIGEFAVKEKFIENNGKSCNDVRWNDDTIMESVEQVFKKHKSDIAVQSDNDSLTYRQLDIATRKIIRRFQRLNVDVKNPIAIFMDRSIEFIVTSFAILRFGGAYTPVPPYLPKERQKHILEKAGVRCFIFNDEHFEAELNMPDLTGIDFKNIMADEEVWDNLPVIDKNSLAYVLFTSGSTGTPKGVMGYHAGLHNRLRWMIREFHINSESVIFQKTPISFDVSIWELFLPLMVGAKSIVASPEGHKDNSYLIDIIVKEKVSLIHFVPTMFLNFLNHTRSRDCSSVKHYICSGEALTESIADKFFSVFPDGNLSNLYGPTEASIDVTCWHALKKRNMDFIPIGKPISNTQIYILKEDDTVCADGEIGEIAIGGVNVAKGYINAKELTDKKFINLPGTAIGTVYRTGDLGRYHTDGNIEYIGRIDSQVQLRGNRIELGEISAVLNRHEAVSHSVVKYWRYSDLDQFLAAYVIADKKLEAGFLKDYLRDFLPDIMIPSFIVNLKSFEFNSSGKIDMKSLPDPRTLNTEKITNDFELSINEKKLKNICERLFHVQPIRVNQNFFDVGANSLMLAELQIIVEKEFGVHISYTDFFKHPNIRDLLDFLNIDQRSTDKGQPGLRDKNSESINRLKSIKQQVRRRRNTAHE